MDKVQSPQVHHRPRLFAYHHRKVDCAPGKPQVLAAKRIYKYSPHTLFTPTHDHYHAGGFLPCSVPVIMWFWTALLSSPFVLLCQFNAHSLPFPNKPTTPLPSSPSASTLKLNLALISHYHVVQVPYFCGYVK